MKSDKTVLLLAAAGLGVRMRAVRPKIWTEVLGKPLLWRALNQASKADELDEIVVIAPQGEAAKVAASVSEWKFAKSVRVVEGGARRQDSVRLGTQALPENCGIVVVHDAARIFASPELFSKVIEAARRSGAATAAISPVDSVVQASGDEIEYLDRTALKLIQTPQAFQAKYLIEAHRKAALENVETTDDISLVKRIGVKVEIVEGESSNFKITYPEDVERAEYYLNRA